MWIIKVYRIAEMILTEVFDQIKLAKRKPRVRFDVRWFLKLIIWEISRNFFFLVQCCLCKIICFFTGNSPHKRLLCDTTTTGLSLFCANWFLVEKKFEYRLVDSYCSKGSYVTFASSSHTKVLWKLGNIFFTKNQ